MKFSIIALLLLAVSCSSRSFKRDYKVVDASHKEIPEWINEPMEFAEDEDDDDFESHRYYVYSTEPKNSKTIACEIAKACATSEIASEITQFIQQSLASTIQGDPTEMDQKLSEYVEDNLAKETQSFVIGSKTFKKYWEKRRFEKDLGAKKDYDGYVCSVLVKISKENLELAFNRANQKLVEKADTTKAKAKVAKVIEDAREAFNNN